MVFQQFRKFFTWFLGFFLFCFKFCTLLQLIRINAPSVYVCNLFGRVCLLLCGNCWNLQFRNMAGRVETLLWVWTWNSSLSNCLFVCGFYFLFFASFHMTNPPTSPLSIFHILPVASNPHFLSLSWFFFLLIIFKPFTLLVLWPHFQFLTLLSVSPPLSLEW